MLINFRVLTNKISMFKKILYLLNFVILYYIMFSIEYKFAQKSLQFLNLKSLNV